MRRLCFVFFGLCLMALQGCSAVAVSAGSIVAGTGVNHTLSGISYKTFNVSVGQLKVAAVETLSRLDMPITGKVRTKTGWLIGARAIGRRIEVDLEGLTRRATRMRVVAHEGDIFFKDSATSTEIIVQTVQTLDMQAAADWSRRLTEPNVGG